LKYNDVIMKTALGDIPH